MLLVNCGGGSSGGSSVVATPAPTTAATAAIWIQPRPASAGGPGIPAGGSTDFTTMFSGTANWSSTAAHTAVFGFYAGWVADIDTPTLTAAVNFLTAQHLAIELEAPSLQATATCGTGVEGYVPYGQTLATFTNGYLQRLKALGADVRYIKVDEPFFFGSDAISSPNSCAWPVATVAQDVAHYVQLVHTTYPNAQVGDVEPIIATGYGTDPVTALSGWHDAFKTAMGAPFPFFIADMDFGIPNWLTLAVNVQQSMRARGEQFGIIFIGDPTDSSDAIWSGKTVSRSQTFASTIGSAPDFVFFQSWDPFPQNALPESSATTFTGTVKSYIDSRTHERAAETRCSASAC